MDQLSELFEPIIDFILGNIGIVIFAIFLLSGLFGRGDKNKEQQRGAPEEPQRQQRPRPRTQGEGEVDNRPLAERLAEAFGVEIPEEQMQPRQRPQQQPQRQSTSQPESASPWWGQTTTGQSEGRRSTTFGNVQDNYPDLFGGPSLFEQQDRFEESTRWGFDETEWGTTFDRNEDQWGDDSKWGNENQWGNTFPDRKSDEPQVLWPNQF